MMEVAKIRVVRDLCMVIVDEAVQKNVEIRYRREGHERSDYKMAGLFDNGSARVGRAWSRRQLHCLDRRW